MRRRNRCTGIWPAAINFSTVRRLTLRAFAVALRSTKRILGDSEDSVVVITMRIVTAENGKSYCHNIGKILADLLQVATLSSRVPPSFFSFIAQQLRKRLGTEGFSAWPRITGSFAQERTMLRKCSRINFGFAVCENPLRERGNFPVPQDRCAGRYLQRGLRPIHLDCNVSLFGWGRY
jgi:hypothetical protein